MGVKSSVITERDNTTKFEILLTFDPSPEIFIFILSVSGFTVEGKHFDLDIMMGGDMKCLQLGLGLGGSLCNYSCPWCRVHINQRDDMTKPLASVFGSNIKFFNSLSHIRRSR
jgi:hypothetical protein